LVSADQVYIDERGADFMLMPASAGAIEGVFKQLEDRLLASVPDRSAVKLHRTFDARLMGQGFDTPFIDAPETITAGAIEGMLSRFHAAYEQRNGNRFEAIPVMAKTWRVQAVVEAAKVQYPTLETRSGGQLEPIGSRTIRHLHGEDVPAACYARADLLHGDQFDGPAIVTEDLSTTFVPKGCHLVVGSYGELEITKTARSVQ
jgi:N-methylhydantoinase A